MIEGQEYRSVCCGVIDTDRTTAEIVSSCGVYKSIAEIVSSCGAYKSTAGLCDMVYNTTLYGIQY